jgi:DNA polymerase III sliding clamp (beta) subunit (PCNA family)
MKVRRYELSSALQLACKLAEKPRSVKGVLKYTNFCYVRVQAPGMIDYVKVNAIDQNSMLAIDLQRTDDYSHGSRQAFFDVLLPAHELYTLIKCQKTDRSMVEFKMDTFDVSVALETGTFKFPVLSGDVFPLAPSSADLPIATYYDAKDLASCLDFVLPASSTDETRPHLNSVCFENEKLLTTDGHRLHAAETKVSLNGNRVLSRNHAFVLRAMCDCPLIKQHVAVQLRDKTCASGGVFYFNSVAVVFTAQMLDVEFPPWNQVVPKIDDVYTMKTKLFVTAVKNAPVGSDRSAGIQLVVNGTVKVEVRTNDRQSSVEVKPLHCADRNVTICLCARYLKEAIDTPDETLTVQVNGKLDPVVVRHGRGSFAVLMPMRA